MIIFGPLNVIEDAHEYGMRNGGAIRFVKLDRDGTRHEANRTTCEELLQICIHRLEYFQLGPYPCLENEVAIAALTAAYGALQSRTKRRVAAGIEGQHKESE